MKNDCLGEDRLEDEAGLMGFFFTVKAIFTDIYYRIKQKITRIFKR